MTSSATARARRCPTDRDTDFACIEQIVVVFGIADPHRVVDRHPQRQQRLAQAGGLGDGLRQNHQPAAIERQDERLFERPDHVEHRAGPLGIGLHDRLAGRERDATPLEFLEEGRTGHMSDDHVPAARGELEHGTILSDDDVEAGQVSGDVMEIGQPASGDEDDHDPRWRASPIASRTVGSNTPSTAMVPS